MAVPADGYLIGYARVSTEDQSLDLQIDALRRAGVRDDNLHVDKASGKSVKNRRGLLLALKDCREGDTLCVWRLDRLTRYMPDIYWILGELERKGANLCSLTEHIDIATPAGMLGLNNITAFAQFERDSISQRTKAGLAVIREKRGKGFKWGPKPKMTPAKIECAGRLLNAGKSGPQVAKMLKVSTASIYSRWQKKVRKDGSVVFIRRKPVR